MSGPGPIAGGRAPTRSAASPNRFFVWPRAATSGQPLVPPSALAANAGDMRYFSGVARELNRLLPEQGTTFLITWHLDAFDERFRDAVVLLIGDEKHQVPSYAREVRAIFKTGGTRRNPLAQTLRLHPSIAWRQLLRDGRNAAEASLRRGPARRVRQAPMFELPIGYFNLRDVPFVPFGERDVDVFFAGSVESERGFTARPRLAARRQMSVAVAAARERLPALRVDCTNAGPFANPRDMLDPERYSRRLMAARIALCPRGNIDETFRLVEAARCGCIAICEPLPGRWYNRACPAIQIDRWSALPATLEALAADPARMARRSELMRNWWAESLSETAAARFIASTIPPSR